MPVDSRNVILKHTDISNRKYAKTVFSSFFFFLFFFFFGGGGGTEAAILKIMQQKDTK